MPRKRKSFFVDLIGAPWWLSLVLAAGAWLVGELVGAYGESLAGLPAHQVHVQILTQLVPAATLFLRFLALVFCFTAVVSFFRRRRRAKLLKTHTDLQSIRDLSWQDFERYVGEVYRRLGYTVEETGPGADGGVDLIARKNGEKVLVQCKRWRTDKVGVEKARELFGVVKAEGATKGVLVTSGAFTPAAVEFAQSKADGQLDLVDGEGLVRLIGGAADTPRSLDPPGERASRIETPSCPRCQAPMVERTAKRGQHAGGGFWGCPKFPSCKGMRDRDGAVIGR